MRFRAHGVQPRSPDSNATSCVGVKDRGSHHRNLHCPRTHRNRIHFNRPLGWRSSCTRRMAPHGRRHHHSFSHRPILVSLVSFLAGLLGHAFILLDRLGLVFAPRIHFCLMSHPHGGDGNLKLPVQQAQKSPRGRSRYFNGHMRVLSWVAFRILRAGAETFCFAFRNFGGSGSARREARRQAPWCTRGERSPKANAQRLTPDACSSRARRFLPPQRQEVLRPLDRLADFAQQFLQVFIAVHEINL